MTEKPYPRENDLSSIELGVQEICFKIARFNHSYIKAEKENSQLRCTLVPLSNGNLFCHFPTSVSPYRVLTWGRIFQGLRQNHTTRAWKFSAMDS